MPRSSASFAATAASSTDGIRLLALDLLLDARDRLLEGLQVGEHQLGVDRLEVVLRVDVALDVHDVVVGEAAHDLRDRVGLADVREELVAEPLALARAAHDARDVDERHRRGQDALGVEDLGELRQPGVGQAHDADVRLDRRERIVRREHVVLGQRVEQGGLADVGQADDADSESHGGQVYVAVRDVDVPGRARVTALVGPRASRAHGPVRAGDVRQLHDGVADGPDLVEQRRAVRPRWPARSSGVAVMM